MADETTLFEEKDIKITNLRAIFGDKTYAMSNITSVSRETKDSLGCALPALVIIGIMITIFSFIDGPSWGTAAIGIFMAGAGIIGAKNQKPDHIVQIGSSSGEIKAYTSQDRELIEKIVNALNDAIIQKG